MRVASGTTATTWMTGLSQTIAKPWARKQHHPGWSETTDTPDTIMYLSDDASLQSRKCRKVTGYRGQQRLRLTERNWESDRIPGRSYLPAQEEALPCVPSGQDRSGANSSRFVSLEDSDQRLFRHDGVMAETISVQSVVMGGRAIRAGAAQSVWRRVGSGEGRGRGLGRGKEMTWWDGSTKNGETDCRV